MKQKILFLFISMTFLSFVSVERKDIITIFMIGDSTMANKSIRHDNLERGWGQMLPGYLTEDVRVDNHAMNGRSSLSFINEGRWDTVVSKIKKGDYVFIQFGHNDEKPATNLHTVPGGTFDDNLRRFVNETRAKGAYPVLFNSIVRRNFPPGGTSEHQGSYLKEGDLLVDTHGEYLVSPRRVAKEMNVPFIDMNKLTHDLVSGMGREESKKLFMWVPKGIYKFSPQGKIDNTHLNIYGGRVLAGIAISEVAKAVPALAPFIRYYDYVVAKDGSGDFFTIREAVCAALEKSKGGIVNILVRPGQYDEKVNISNAGISIIKQTGVITDDFGFSNGIYVTNYKGNKECAISYTYDDGLEEHYTLVFPEMEKRNIKGTFWIWGKCIENESEMQGKPRITWEQIKEMASSGHEISNHSWSHKNLTKLTLDELKMEIEKNDSAIFEKTGIRSRTFCYPFNAFNDTVLQLASKNRVATRTRQYALGTQSTPNNLEQWVNDLLLAGAWGVAMIHGISYGYDAFTSSGILWEHFDKVEARRDKIWVGTFKEVASYIEERNSVRLDFREEGNRVFIKPTLSRDKEIFNQPLTMAVDKPEVKKLSVRQNDKEIAVEFVDNKALFDFDPFGGVITIDFN